MKIISRLVLFLGITFLIHNTAFAQSVKIIDPNTGEYLGNLNNNPYDPNSVANPYGQYGSKYSSKSINNPYGQYGSPYSTSSAHNPYTTGGPILVGPTHMGNLNNNLNISPYDPSHHNPYRRAKTSPNYYQSYATATKNGLALRAADQKMRAAKQAAIDAKRHERQRSNALSRAGAMMAQGKLDDAINYLYSQGLTDEAYKLMDMAETIRHNMASEQNAAEHNQRPAARAANNPFE